MTLRAAFAWAGSCEAFHRSLFFRGALLTLLALTLAPQIPAADAPVEPAFIVVAPDRGFLGNEEVSDAVAPFADLHTTRLVFVTDERTRDDLATAVAELSPRGERPVVVLPLFLSPADPRLTRVHDFLAAAPDAPATVTQTFGESVHAVEALADRLRQIPAPAGRRLVVIGCGANSVESRARMTDDEKRQAAWAAHGLGFAAVEAVVAPDPWAGDLPELTAAFQADLKTAVGDGAVVVPFLLCPRLDSHMTFEASLRRTLPVSAELVPRGATPHPLVSPWLFREAARYLPLTPDEVGVVVLAHGADYHWNERMRRAIAPLRERFLIEPAFSMADPVVVERAVRRLEDRGARVIVVVRVFGLESSFESAVEQMLGLDAEAPGGGLNEPPAPAVSSGAIDDATGHAHASHRQGNRGRDRHAHDGGHHGDGRPARIRSTALFATAGGLEDHPLFARALLDRALELSRDPARETLFLTAHGVGDDAENSRWQSLLSSLAGQMLAEQRRETGTAFKGFEVVTWQEDWPDKRGAEVARARARVAAVAESGGRALVIPARTAGQGPEAELLAGLAFELGSGFAPHPLFPVWIQSQIDRALAPMGLRADLPPLPYEVPGRPESTPWVLSSTSAERAAAPQREGSPPD